MAAPISKNVSYASSRLLSDALEEADRGHTTRPRLLLDWRRMRQFLFAYERGSIGQAAGELNVTQPALSKSLRSLEEDLQVRLFERTPLGVVPTVFGETLALHAKAIQSEIRRAQLQIEVMRGAVKGHVTIGIGPSLASSLMPIATERLLIDRPGITLTVREGMGDDLLPALRRGEVDLALGAWANMDRAELATEVIYRDRMRVFAGVRHPLADRRASLGELLDYPWALPPRDQTWRRRLDELFISQALSPLSPTVESNSSTYLKGLLHDSRFLTFLPRQSLLREEQAGLVRALDVRELTLESEVLMVHRDRAVVSPAAQVFQEHARAVGAEMMGAMLAETAVGQTA